MHKKLYPNPENCTLSEIDIAMKVAPDMRSYNRMNAIKAMILQLLDHTGVSQLYNVNRNTVNNWVKRFNSSGIDGLIEKSRKGRPKLISETQNEEYKKYIENPEKAGECHWTGKKFHGFLKDKFDHEVSYRTVIRWLHNNDYRLKIPRPWPDKQDEEKRTIFIGKLREWMNDENIDIWYQDETGIEGDPRPRRRWAKKGDKIKITRNANHLRLNVTGTVCPRTGEFYALEFSHSDSTTFQIFLDHINKCIETSRKRNLIICDNASWHKNKSLNWGKFEPVFLPPYSPDLNPIERLWLLIKSEWFTDFIAKNMNELIERVDRSLLWAIDRIDKNKKTCAI